MKTRFILIGVAALALTAVSCNKQEVLNEKETVKETVEENPISITAVWDEATKANVSDVGAFTWTATTDKVAYWKNGAWAQSGGAQTGDVATTNFTINDTNRDNWAVYPYSIIDNAPNKNTKYGQSGTALNVYLPKTYELGSTDLVSNRDVHLCCPMIADNTQPVADGWSFKQLCGVFRMTVNCIPPSVDKITVDFGHPVAGSFDIPAGIAPATSSIAYANAAGDNSNVVTITFNAAGGTTWRDNVTFNLPWPTGEYGDITITMYNGSTEVISMTRPAGKTGNYTAARAYGRKVAAGFPIFSVSDTKRVVIAPSNLQLKRDASYAAGDGTAWAAGQGLEWSFMTNPWDYVEGDWEHKWKNADKGYTINYDKQATISLFGWGCTGYTNWATDGVTLGTDYGTAYQPWSVSGTNTQYGPVLGNTKGVNDLTGVFEPGDWGYVAGTLAGYNTWRLLNSDECDYLLFSRAGQVFTYAVVNDMRGVILLPDNFIDPNLNGGTNAVVTWSKTFTDNVYTSDQWKGMAASGAILLPVVAFRTVSGSYAKQIKWYNAAYYHLSTHASYSGKEATHSYDIVIDPGTSNGYGIEVRNGSSGGGRYTGKTVRLARPIQ